MPTVPSEAFRGWGSIIGVAEETTYGTSVAASIHWLGVVSHTLQPEREVIPVPYLGSANSQISSVPRGSEIIRHDYGGDIETLVEYANPAFFLCLEHFMGAMATTGANPYTHTFTIDESKYYDGTNIGLTMQVIAGQHSTLGKCEVVTGTVISAMEIAWEARGLVSAKFSVIAVSGGTFTTITGTPAVTDSERAKGSHCARMSWNSGNYQLNKVTIKADRHLERRPNLGNGLYTDKPQPNAPMEVTISGELDWISHALDTGIDAVTSSDAVFTFTGTSPNTLTITVDGAVLTSLTRPLTGAGRRTQSFEMRGHYVDSTNLGLKLVFVDALTPAHG